MIEDTLRKRKYELSDIQLSYLLGSKKKTFWGGVDCQGYMEINFGNVELEKFCEAWDEIVKRHPILRAQLLGINYCINEKNISKLSIIELASNKSDVDKRILKERNKLINIRYCEEKVAFRGSVISTSNALFLLLSVNLIFIDFTSVQIILNDLSCRIRGIDLKELNGYYDYYSFRNNNRLDNEKYISASRYWGNRIKNFPSYPKLNFQKNIKYDENSSSKFRRISTSLKGKVLNKLEKTSKNNGFTLASMMLCAFSYCLSRHSRNKRFIVNIPYNNRPMGIEGVEDIVGEFTDIDLLEVDLREQQTFCDFVKKTFYRMLMDMENREYSGLKVLSNLKESHDEYISPFVFTSVVNHYSNNYEITYGLTRTPQVWLDCQTIILQNKNLLMVSWDIREGVFDHNKINDLFYEYINLLKLLSEDEKLWEKSINEIELYMERYNF